MDEFFTDMQDSEIDHDHHQWSKEGGWTQSMLTVKIGRYRMIYSLLL
jgi:hypothetical protein